MLSKTFTYKSRKGKYAYRIKHGLNSEFLNITVFALIAKDTWSNVIVSIVEDGKDHIIINLTQKHKIKVSIIALD